MRSSSCCLAGCLIENFAIFPGWVLVCTADLAVRRRDRATVGLAIYVTILTCFLIYMWAFTTEEMTALVSTAFLRFSLAVMAISWISSFVVQIPLQLRIGGEKNKSLVRRLIKADWMRILSMAVHCGAVIWAVLA